MKDYPIVPTKIQLKKMKIYWATLKTLENKFYKDVGKLQNLMSEDIGIEDLEFFMTDTGFAGIGNFERTLKLIQQEELEK